MKSGLCLCGSANITGKGLGLSEGPSNVEACCWSELNVGDWIQIYKVLKNSTKVTNDAYNLAKSMYKVKQWQDYGEEKEFEITQSSKEFSIAELPALESPATLILNIEKMYKAESVDDIGCLMHDIVLYSEYSNQSSSKLFSDIESGFLSTPFIREIVKKIHSEGEMRFGEVSSWIHSHCQDVPLPYRVDVKDATRRLYNWLEYFVPQISWHIPGRRSQVIVWRD